mmetsp:Transcript_15474/g.33619  ORF Transcript_15474/g.33619 Transcript_15474/m.33619 type:complete len:350 (-) Transcript_15474:2-1051(-)
MEITAPDDFHLHVRDGEMMKMVVPHSCRVFQRAIIMPNLVPPVVSVEDAEKYRERIQAAIPPGVSFEPMMTLYLTGSTTPDDIRAAAATGFVKAVKWYPAGATTNSDAGLPETKVDLVLPTLKAMAEIGLPLLCHGESTDPTVDVFDREAVWVERVLKPLIEAVPELKIVMEHITTKQGAEAVLAAPKNVAATITVQHLMLNRNALFSYGGKGGLRPHNWCLPILKREEHRLKLVEVATSGNPKFFAGTDSAPHPTTAKESACGCAGCFTASTALECYAEVFEDAGCLEKFEAFVAHNGADFYGLPRNSAKVKLERKTTTVPTQLVTSDGISVTPFRAGEEVRWTAVRR